MISALAIGVLLAASEAADAGIPEPGRFIGYVEWVLAAPLDASRRGEAEGLFQTALRGKSRDDRQLVSRASELERELSGYTSQELAQLRSSVADEYVRTLRSRYKGSAVARWLLKLHVDATRQIAPGDPPLTRLESDALYELAAYAAGRPAADVDRDAFAAALSRRWASLEPGDRAAAADAPARWKRLRTRLDTARDDEREGVLKALSGRVPDAGVAGVDALVAVAPALAAAVQP